MIGSNSDVIVPTDAVGEFFDRLHAPLGDWGFSSSTRNAHGLIFFLAWADRRKVVDGATYRLLGKPHPVVAEAWRRDVMKVRGGAKAYMVIATAEDTGAVQRVIKLVNEGVVTPVGRLELSSGEVWAECLAPIPVGQVTAR